MSDISKENYEDFLNFEKLWDEWRLKEEVSLKTFVGSGYHCVEEFYNFSKEYFGNRFKQQLAERDALILELEKVREFYANGYNWVGPYEINDEKWIARTPLKNQKLLDEIKEGKK